MPITQLPISARSCCSRFWRGSFRLAVGLGFGALEPGGFVDVGALGWLLAFQRVRAAVGPAGVLVPRRGVGTAGVWSRRRALRQVGDR